MGFFTRDEQPQKLAVQPVEIIQPRHTGEELERMVGEVYKEKMSLQKQLDAANAKLADAEDTKTKLSAAELFAEQSQNEIKSLKRKAEQLEADRDRWKDEATSLKDKASVACIEKQRVSASVRADVVDEMLDALIYENGSWSKERVRTFIAGFRDESQPTERDDS